MKPIEQARAEMEADRADFIKKTGPILMWPVPLRVQQMPRIYNGDIAPQPGLF